MAGRLKNLAVLVSGSGSNLQAVIDACTKKQINAEIKIVISSRPDVYALTRAKAAKIDTAVCAKADYETLEKRDEAILKLLIKHKADLVICAGYLGIITNAILDKFNNKIINIHPSLLPNYGGKDMYGLRVHEAVIAAKEPFSGATVHYVTSGIDKGQILAQEALQVLPHYTPEILQKEILENIEHKLLVQVIKELCN